MIDSLCSTKGQINGTFQTLGTTYIIQITLWKSVIGIHSEGSI
ncbi:hypothetical protein QFZ77_002540 [Paenibacillus sp. V4I3]|nr:hypothetical protein [Paenibacillus sp. V4I3]